MRRCLFGPVSRSGTRTRSAARFPERDLATARRVSRGRVRPKAWGGSGATGGGPLPTALQAPREAGREPGSAGDRARKALHGPRSGPFPCVRMGSLKLTFDYINRGGSASSSLFKLTFDYINRGGSASSSLFKLTFDYINRGGLASSPL